MSTQRRVPRLPIAVMMVPVAVATYVVGRLDGLVGRVALGWIVLVVAAAAVGSLLRDLDEPPARPRLLGVVVVGLAAWLTLTWYGVAWAAGGDAGRIGGAVGSLLMAQVGGLLGGVLLAPRPMDRRPSWTPGVALAVLPVVVAWFAWSHGDRQELLAMADDLEATGVAPYLVELDGYDLTEVRTDLGGFEDVPGIWYQMTPEGADPGDATLGVWAVPGFVDVCGEDDGCDQEPDGPVFVEVDAAGSADVMLAIDSSYAGTFDREAVRDQLAAAEPTTYDVLAELYPEDLLEDPVGG